MTNIILERPIASRLGVHPDTASPPVRPKKFGADAAMTATGEDIDNDHADERPIDRSQDAEPHIYEDADREFFEKH